MKKKRKRKEPFDFETSKIIQSHEFIDPRTGNPGTSSLLEDKNGQLMGEISYSFTLYAKPLNDIKTDTPEK